MTTVDDIPWGEPSEPQMQLARPRKCRRHEWYFGSLGEEPPVTICSRCGKLKDLAASKRGRNNRNRGNAIERFVCSLLGIKRVGQYGGPEDGGSASDHLVVQVKSGGAFQDSLRRKILTVPANADQLRGWVTVSTPGAGARREGVISFDLREFADWYGKGMPEEVGE